MQTGFKKFKPNRSKKGLAMTLLRIFCGFLILLGTILTAKEIIGHGFHFDELGKEFKRNEGLILLIFGLALFLIGNYLTSPLKITYYVGADRIRIPCISLQVGIRNAEFLYQEIESLSPLKENTAESVALVFHLKADQIMREAMQGDRNFASMTGTFLEHRSKGFEPYVFMSVPVTFMGSKRTLEVSRVDLPCDVILMKLRNSKHYFISPLDINGFIEEVKRQIQ